MANKPGLPSPPAGFLWQVAWHIDTFASRMETLSQDIADIYIIGRYLATPFYTWSRSLVQAARFLRSADDTLQTTRNWTNYVFEKNGFADFIDYVSGEYKSIRTDAKLWLAGKLAGFGWWMYSLLYTPKNFVNYYVRSLAPDMASFLDNPGSWVIARIAGFSITLYMFVHNPKQWEKDLFVSIASHLVNFFSDPDTWVKQRLNEISGNYILIATNASLWVANQLASRNSDLYYLVHDPEYLIKKKIAVALNLSYGIWDDPLYWGLYYMLVTLGTNLANFQTRIKNLVVDFILMFI